MATTTRGQEGHHPETGHRGGAVRRSDDADAFIPDPSEGPARSPDELAEALGENFVEGATGAELGRRPGTGTVDDEDEDENSDRES